MDQKPVDYYDEHKVKQYDRVRYLYDTNSGQGRGHVVTRWRDGNGIFNPGNPGFIPGPGTGKLNSVAGNGKGPCGPGGGTPPLCQDTEFSPGNSANANGAGAGNETLRQDYAYNYQNRVVQVDSTVGPTHQSTVKFAYDAAGMRFFKKYEDNNRSIHTYYMAPDYQIRSTNTGEVHTIVIRKPDGILATMSFDEKFHLASNFPASHYTDRLAYQMDNLYDPAQGISGIFTNMGSAAVMLYKLAEVYDEYVTLAYYVTVFIAILAAIFWLISLWRAYKITGERETEVIPGNLGMRLTALFSIILFHGMLGASCSGSETSPKFIVPGGGNISGIVQGLMGAHFYSNDAVGSVTLVTNEAGVPITRYVYKPYGELNMELTDVDMDGNGIFYESIYKYNGQEFDYELGVYNYNARNYDQMTGRFMQTDPKFTERAGFDAYDPYSYVSSNPVNFTDPTGESWLSENVNKATDYVKKTIQRNMKAIRIAATVVAAIYGGAILIGMTYTAATALTAGFGAAAMSIATNVLLTAGGFAAAGIIGAVVGGVIGGAVSYLYGGLKNSRTNKLDWNDQEARNYGQQGMETGARIGFSAGIAAGLAAGGGWLAAGIAYVSTFFTGSSGFIDDYLLPGGGKFEFKERNLADRGPAGKLLSEIDYNGDGHLDLLEMAIYQGTGARRSLLDYDHSGRVSNGEFALHYWFHYVTGQGQAYDSLMMFAYGTGVNVGEWMNQGN